MKTKFTLLLSFLLLTVITYAQNVPQKQMALVGKKTATWCGPCGTWGWNLMNELYDENEGKAVLFEFHNSTSSQLHSADALALYNNYEYRSSTPAFHVGPRNMTAYSATGGIYSTTTKTNINKLVDSFAAVSPVANAGYDFSIVNDVITINTKTKFFQNTSGDYYLGVYIIEENIEKYQNGIGNNAIHKKILRAKASTNIMGDLIVSGSANANQEFTKTFTYNLNTSWNKDNIKVFTVIWKKNGSSYEFENAYSGVFATSIDEPAQDAVSMKLVPSVTVANQPVKLQISGVAIKEPVKIEVYDQLGRNIQTVFEGQLNNDNREFNINSNLTTGIYFVTVASGSKDYTKKLMIIE